MTIRRGRKSAATPERRERVEASLVRFSPADIRMMAGVLVLMLSGALYMMNQAVDKAVTKLELTMSKTYVSKEEFMQSANAINSRIGEVHADMNRIASAAIAREEKKK